MKIATLRRRQHDDGQLRRFRALYEGGETWRDLLDEWLPQYDYEPEKRWKARKAESTYTNHAGSIVDFFGGHLFSEPVALKTDEKGRADDAKWLAGWTDNVDQVGTSFTDWLHDHLFTQAMVGRVSYAWINLPAAGEFASRADQEAAGALDAFLVPIPPEQVVWAQWSGAELQWLLRECVVEDRASPDEPVRKIWRWTAITATEIVTWEWTPPPETPNAAPRDEEEAAEVGRVVHKIGRLPVIPLCLKPGLWAMAKIADPATAHLRARNHLSWHLAICANPLLVVKADGETDSPILGTGYYLRVPSNGDVIFAEPSGATAKILQDDIDGLREELYRVVHQLAQAADSNATRTQMSAESKESDWQAEQIILAAYASAVKDVARRILSLVCEIRGIDFETVKISGLEGWQQEDVAGELETMALALDARTMSPTFRREVAKRQARRVLVDVSQETLDKIDKEIDTAPAEDPALYAPPPQGAGNGKPPRSAGAAGRGSRRPAGA